MSDQEQQQQQSTPVEPSPVSDSVPAVVDQSVVIDAEQQQQQQQQAPLEGGVEGDDQQQLDQQQLDQQQHAANPASAIEGGREVSNKILYVGNLHSALTEDNLRELFLVAGPIQTIKILNDKNKPGFNYAFVEFENTQIADVALRSFNGHILNNVELKINWAYQSSNVVNNNLSENDEPVFNIFVGDLSPEVDDEALKNAFVKFNSLKQAHVMWDMQTSRSRGYGFVTFSIESDAELALQTMNGEWLNGRAIRCNWASHKQLHNNQNQSQNFRHNNNHNNLNNRHNNNLHQHHNNHHNNNNNNRLPNNQQFRPFNGNVNNNNNNNNGILPPQLIGGIPQQQQQQQQLNNSLAPNGGNAGGIPPPPQFQQNNNGLPPPPQQQQQQQQQVQAGNLNPSLSANGELNNGNAGNNNGNNNVPVMSPQSYDIVLRQTPSWQTTVYLGNIAHFTQQNDIIPLVQNFGYIVDFKFHPERGCAFVKYDSHERAALAIVQLAGFNVNGRPLKCGWGKDRPPMGHGQFQNFVRGVPPPNMYGQGRP